MRKVKAGQLYKECGKDDRKMFRIEYLVNRTGKARTSKGTLIKVSRLASTKHYKLIEND